MRRSISLVLAAFILLPAGEALAQTPGFRDVAGTRYVEAYQYLTAKGVVQGFSDGTGRPHQLLTRAEALKVLVQVHPALRDRAREIAKDVPSISLFSDVDQTAWYAPSLEAAFEGGIVTGYPDRTFRPGAPLTAEEGIVLLLRSQGEDAPHLNIGRPWYANAAERAFSRNLVSLHERIRRGDLLTRGQFFDIVYRQEAVQRDGLTAFVEPAWTPPLRPVDVASLPVPAEAAVTVKPFSISIPTLGITDLAVVHPQDPTSQKGLLTVLKDGVGHLFSYPGGDGKIMIYGHSSGYAWDVSKYTKIFRKISALNQGDRVYVRYRGKVHVYEVTYKQSVAATDLRPFSGDGEELILYTCWPPDSIKERYLVHATPVDEVAAK